MPTLVKTIGNANNGAVTWNNAAGNAVIGSVTDLGAWAFPVSAIVGGGTTPLAGSEFVTAKNQAGRTRIAVSNQQSDAAAEAEVMLAALGNSWSMGVGSSTFPTYGNALTFRVDVAGGARTVVANATTAGAWTLGAAETNQTQTVYGKAFVRAYIGGGSAIHEFQNRNTANSAGGSSYLKATSYSSTAGLILSNSSTDRWLMGSDTSESSSSLYFYNYDSAAAIVGKVSTAGAWTFGTSGGTQTHSINGTQVNFTSTSTSTAFFHNYSTGATLRAQVGVNGTSATIIAGALGTANYYQIAAVSGIEFGDTANNVRGRMVSSTGAWSNTAGGSWGTLSDIRLKDNISDLASGLSLICSLRPVAYTWTNAEFGVNRPTVGFIAQEIEQVNPSWIQTVESVKLSDQEEIKDVKEIHMDASFNAYLVKAIQELKAELDEAKAEIEILKGN